jgi:hypothetical protein
MAAQIMKTEGNYASSAPTALQKKKLRIFIPYDGSETADATLTGLSRAGLPNEIEALVAVTDVWLPLSPREITRTVDARRLKLLTSGLSSHAPALQDHEEQRVLSIEAKRRLRSMFPSGVVKTESFQDTSAVAETILRKAKHWDAELIILGANTSPSQQITDYVGPALRVAHDAHCSVRIARRSDFKAESAIKIIIVVDESSSAHNVVQAVAGRNWPTGTIANIVVTRTPGPRRVTTDAEAAQVLDSWTHVLRAAGLEVSMTIADDQPEAVLLHHSQQAPVDCVFVDSQHAQDEVVEGSGLSQLVKTLILGAHCSVEVIRSNRTDQLQPAA